MTVQGEDVSIYLPALGFSKTAQVLRGHVRLPLIVHKTAGRATNPFHKKRRLPFREAFACLENVYAFEA